MKSDVETASAADCMVQALARLLAQAGWSKMSKNTLQGLRRRDAGMRNVDDTFDENAIVIVLSALRER
jgi:hypothetical protein